MNNEIERLLTEYEEMTGRSKELRADISIKDFLALRDYALKLGNDAINDKNQPSSIRLERADNVEQNKQIRHDIQSKESTLATKKESEPKAVITSINAKSQKQIDDTKEQEDIEEDEVSILRSIID